MSVLVTYASKHGATEDIAERSAATLRQMRMDAVVLPVESAGDLKPYEAVVIGSAVYFGSWRKVATDFVLRNREVLAARPVWLFSSGPTGRTTQPDLKQVAEVEAPVHPQEHRLFGGELDPHKLSFPERMIIKGVKAPEGDFRDCDEIDACAESIRRALATASHPA